MFEELENKKNEDLPTQGESLTDVTPESPDKTLENKPKGSLEDIFSETEKPEIFKPKQPEEMAVPQPIAAESGVDVKKIIILLSFVVIMLVLGGGGFWLYKTLMPGIKGEITPTPEEIVTEEIPEETTEATATPEQTLPETGPEQAASEATTTGVFSGEQATESPESQTMDTDQDGLLDQEELTIGTDINKVDTDGDGLFDREEVQVYKTNPLNPDTDADGYTDGKEVEGGYNPNGPGKLYEINQ